MKIQETLSRARRDFGPLLLGLVLGLSLTSGAFGQSRYEDRTPRYGGYVPFGAYPADSGAPLGGYTPFGVDGPEAGWLKLDYGFGYDDFVNSNYFGSDVLDGLHRGNSYGFERRPLERGRGIWNSYGSAWVVNPPTVLIGRGRP